MIFFVSATEGEPRVRAHCVAGSLRCARDRGLDKAVLRPRPRGEPEPCNYECQPNAHALMITAATAACALARCRDHGVIRCLGVIAFAFAPLCLCLHQMCPVLPAIPLARRLCPNVLPLSGPIAAAAARLCLWPTAGAL